MEMNTTFAEPGQDIAPDAAPTRKPRVALMGEFSAGKSTLSNMLLGADPLPVKVTATRLPPVWISYGDQAAYRVGMDGSHSPIDMNNLDQVSLEETRLIRLFLKSEALQLCDLIDMPGISDPNMSAEVWQSVIDQADSVVWCTHATQAWRQSEAATWEQIKDATGGGNLLLITQFDKLQSDRDKARVLARVTSETAGQFRAVYPVSLTQALNAGEDSDLWDQSGAAAFTEHFIELLLNPSLRELPVQDEPVEVSQPMAELAEPAAEVVAVPAAELAPELAAELAPEIVAEASSDSGLDMDLDVVESDAVSGAAAEQPATANAPNAIQSAGIRPKRVRRNPADRMRTRLPTISDSTVISVSMGAVDGD